MFTIFDTSLDNKIKKYNNKSNTQPPVNDSMRNHRRIAFTAVRIVVQVGA